MATFRRCPQVVSMDRVVLADLAILESLVPLVTLSKQEMFLMLPSWMHQSRMISRWQQMTPWFPWLLPHSLLTVISGSLSSVNCVLSVQATASPTTPYYIYC